jgi:hypothetical protein
MTFIDPVIEQRKLFECSHDNIIGNVNTAVKAHQVSVSHTGVT